MPIKPTQLLLLPYSKQILQPDVPHSLRLQAILIGGIALVFAKQQMYFLEDLKGLMVSCLPWTFIWAASATVASRCSSNLPHFACCMHVFAEAPGSNCIRCSA